MGLVSVTFTRSRLRSVLVLLNGGRRDENRKKELGIVTVRGLRLRSGATGAWELPDAENHGELAVPPTRPIVLGVYRVAETVLIASRSKIVRK